MSTREHKALATRAAALRFHARLSAAFLSAVAALLLVLLTQTARAQKAPPSAPAAVFAPPLLVQNVGIDQNLGAQIPTTLAFHDETGQAIHLSDLQHGKPIVLLLIQYRCPNLCTVELNDMLSTLKVIPQLIGDQYEVWAVSFDPTETPALAAEKKHGYVASYTRARAGAVNASASWHFLTGDAANIAALTKAVGFRYRFDDATQQFIHPAGLMLLTPEGKIARYFFGIDYDPTDLRLSLVEASHGKIGSFTDKILLFCYHYDPTTGKYGLAVANTLRAGGALTLLLLGAFFTFLWRADRRRTKRLLALSPHAQGLQSPGGDAPPLSTTSEPEGPHE